MPSKRGLGDEEDGVRYQPDDRPPILLTATIGLQLAALLLVGAAVIPTVVFRSAGASDQVLAWAVFASLALCGLTTMVQASPRFAAGYVIVTVARSAAIAVCIAAVAQGGPALLALLVGVTAAIQLLLAARLSLFRRILTPAIAGTVIMLIPVSVVPVVLDNLERIPEGASPAAGGLAALVTVLVMTLVALKGSSAIRLWAPIIGVGAGALCAAPLGLFELARVGEAAWIGLPQGGPPSLHLDFGPEFWALLPAFVIVTLIGTVQSVSGNVAVQRASWRRPRAVDYRSVQNTVAVEGASNLLCALAGTMPNTSRSSGGTFAVLTGMAARRLGIGIGAWLFAFAFLPKAMALMLSIPGPVIAAYVAVMMTMLFMVGIRLVIQDGLDYRKSMIVGISFWVGVAVQNDMVFPEWIAVFAGGLLNNGMTVGGLTAILLTLFVEVTSPRPSRFQADFTIASLPAMREFLLAFAERSGWGGAMGDRLDAASEETILTLIRDEDADESRARRVLRITARKEGRALARLEFLVAVGDENLQDRIAVLEDQTGDMPIERDVSLRLLRHLASSVRHQQYHDTDIVTLHVEVPSSSTGA